MTRMVSIVSLISLMIAVALISCAHPNWLSDQNPFLKNFVNHELLAVLGVVVTITLASAASLHLELNRIEDETQEPFEEARSATKAYAYLLIVLFALALALVVIKPLLASNAHLEAAFNGVAVLIIIVNIMALADLTSAVFAIPPNKSLRKK